MCASANSCAGLAFAAALDALFSLALVSAAGAELAAAGAFTAGRDALLSLGEVAAAGVDLGAVAPALDALFLLPFARTAAFEVGAAQRS